jgi:hypothetical protein
MASRIEISRVLQSFAALLALAVGGCQLEHEQLGLEDPIESQTAAAKSNIDIRRSLVVTEQPILARFSFKRVLDQLVAQSGVPGMTALQLFHQWWDTQNPAPGLGGDHHCNTEVDGEGNPILNGYPYGCRAAATQEEGLESASNPFVSNDPAEYLPIGLFNRFDLAPANGAHCGEHRIVYARRSGISNSSNRNLIIFEANLPNPMPGLGLIACLPIVKLWADLSKESSIEKRASALEKLYFQGAPSFPPVIHVNHFGNNAAGAGQIRTNQFMQTAVTPRVWLLREFKLVRTCSASACTALEMVPATVKGNPFGPLFSPAGTHPQTAAFQQHFLTQLQRLSANTLARIDMVTPDVFNTGQALENASIENNYVAQLGTDPSAFRTAIQDGLTTLGSSLTPDEIVGRAQALSCAGCHRLNANPNTPGVPPIGGGLTWPSSLGFTHITETATQVVGGVTRFLISPALLQDFLPVRKRVIDDFLNDKPPVVVDPSDPIGGRRVH